MLNETETCWLYTITHLDSGNQYIGISINPDRRWKDHKQHCKYENTRFYNALRKYGHDRFIFEVIEEVNSVEEAKLREILLIAEKDPEYNSTGGGDGMWNPTPEVRRKMSEGMRNSPLWAGRMVKVWETRRANTTPEEWSRIMSEAQANMTPEEKSQKLCKWLESWSVRTPEQEIDRQRKRAQTIANWSPEQKAAYSAKITQHNLTRVLSEEAQAKIAQGQIDGGKISGARVREWYQTLSAEQKDARMDNIVHGIKKAAASRTQEERDEITRKRLATRERNGTLKFKRKPKNINESAESNSKTESVSAPEVKQIFVIKRRKAAEV